MPFGKPAPSTKKSQVSLERKGTIDTKAVYKERGVTMRTEKTHVNLDVERVEPDFALVNTGHTVKMSIEFQSVETTCIVTIPTANNPDAIKRGFKQAWQLVEEQLESRQDWAKTVIEALAEVKRNSEGG